MHILIIHQAFAALDEPGGTRHHEMARHLSQMGHRITVIASPVSYITGAARQARIPWVERQDGGEGVTILRAYTYPQLHKSFVHRVFSFFSFMVSSLFIGLSVKDIDLIWGTSPPIFQGITAWMLARLKGAKFLFEVRDLWPAFAIAVGVLTNPVLIKASQWLEKFLYKRADQLMVNSPGFLDHIQKKGGKSIALIPNGADTTMFNPTESGENFRQSNRLENQFIALYAGAHGMSNDLDVVLDAANLLRDRSDITIILLGDGKEKPNLIRRAAKLKLENLHFLPPVPKEGIPLALAAADACIAILKPIELYKTVYPNKVFDYMAAGRATILVIDGVIRQVVEQAGAGTFVPPGTPQALAEAIREMADYPDKTQEMGQAGRAYLEEHFNRSALANKLEALLTNVAEPQD
jgi:glycosyltransferase involved in cell wall biosynthesis